VGLGMGLVVVAFGNIVGGGVRLVLRCGQDRTREGTTDLVGGEANVRRCHKAHPLTSLDGGDWVSILMWAYRGGAPPRPQTSSITYLIGYLFYSLFIFHSLMHQLFSIITFNLHFKY